MQFPLVFLVVLTASTALPTKRQAQNSYGDEPQTPSPSTYNAAAAVVASEYAPAQVSQEAVSAAAPVESSGYRHKRQSQNSYGDEAVVQSAATASYNEITSAAPEYAPAAVVQETATATAAVESSGYRHKRQAQNSYGDEPQTPAPTSYNEATVASAPETAPAEVVQEAATATAAVQSSGYRHKRQSQNSYGDEPQTPAPSTYNQAVKAAAPEYAPAEVSQETVTANAAVESSGYRH